MNNNPVFQLARKKMTGDSDDHDYREMGGSDPKKNSRREALKRRMARIKDEQQSISSSNKSGY